MVLQFKVRTVINNVIYQPEMLVEVNEKDADEAELADRLLRHHRVEIVPSDELLDDKEEGERAAAAKAAAEAANEAMGTNAVQPLKEGKPVIPENTPRLATNVGMETASMPNKETAAKPKASAENKPKPPKNVPSEPVPPKL